jgi:RimJ/RimL family protein N-acetyltransferase
MIHSIAPENLPSQRVAQKLGSRNLGPGKLPAPFEHDSVEIWGQTRDEWTAARVTTP